MVRRFVNIKTIIFIFFCLVFFGCYYDKEQVLYGTTSVDCNTIPARFATEINPIIQSKCATTNCHNSSGAGGVVLLNYTQIKAKADRINQRCVIQKDMPPGNPLTTDERNKLKCWISNGAQNN